VFSRKTFFDVFGDSIKNRSSPMTVLYIARRRREGQQEVMELGNPRPGTIRLGSRTQRPGWVRDRRAAQYYQEVPADVVEEAILREDRVDMRCYGATPIELQMLDATLALVPTDHLQRVVREKTAGLRVVNTTGRGSSYFGGGNVQQDDPATSFDDTLAILVTHSALHDNAALGICPTTLHEFGHVMTHNNGLSYETFSPQRATALRNLATTEGRVSRNPGQFEGLCNAYMYFLCYGSVEASVRRWGTLPSSIQKDPETRDALRRLPAFTRLPAEWQARYAER
jgi:hypothetical protein